MQKYKLTKDPNTVIDVENGRSIPKDHRWWSEYEEWLALGNIPDPAFTQNELDIIAVYEAKVLAIKNARDNSGLKEITVEQAYAYIDDQFVGVTNATQAVVAIKRILKKMVPFILE